ncbi:hypothetical protein P7C73_g4107, partial [Tremellales sp. Uapishka_1]
MEKVSTMSWENGTKAEAMIEKEYSYLSVFSTSDPFPPSASSKKIKDLVAVAQTTLENRPAGNESSSLLSDGAAGDPASLGIAVLIANASESASTQVNGVTYGQAALSELNYLLYVVPKSSTGAISHRADQVQLWADFVYMVPPFLAYYGALTGNATLMSYAANQITLYRTALKQSNNLWNHIAGGSGTSDPNIWSTGNAWVVAGITRVIATLQHSGQDMSSEISQLQGYAEEILTAAEPYITGNGLLRNYMIDNTSFEDTSSSALFAAAGLGLFSFHNMDASMIAHFLLIASSAVPLVYTSARLSFDLFISSSILLAFSLPRPASTKHPRSLPISHSCSVSLSLSFALSALPSSTSTSPTDRTRSRMSTLNLTNTYVPFSLTLLASVSSAVNETGYLSQVVDPNSFDKQGTVSPEGQSFVVLAYAAYNDWTKAGSQGSTGSNPLGVVSAALGALRPVGCGAVAFVLAALASVWI